MSNEKRAMTAEDFMNLEVFSDPQITPDGQAYTYVSTTVNEEKEYESHLFLQKLDGSPVKQWTYGHEKNSHLRFSPDGNQAVFQSSRSGLPQLWVLNTDGGEAKQLTTFKHGAGNPHWSKDGKYIIFTASLEADDDVKKQKEQSKEERQKESEEKKKQPLIVTKLKYKSDANGFHDGKKSQLVLYEVENETFTQLTFDDADHAYQDISPDCKTVLFSANLNEDADYENINDLYTVDLVTKETAKLTQKRGVYHSAAFSPKDRKSVV